MAKFKDIGAYVEPQFHIPGELLNGGISPDGYSVQPPYFRLRSPNHANTRQDVSVTDISPLNLYPGNLQKIRWPQDPLTMGLELEYTIVNAQGERVSLYGRNHVSEVHFNGGDPRISLDQPDDHILLDELGLAPEALKFIGEVNVKPSPNLEGFLSNTYAALRPIAHNLLAHNLYLLPTASHGGYLEHAWDNVAPHEYIARNHARLNGSALSLAATSVQSHIDINFANANFGHVFSNHYNPLIATLKHALNVCAPFHQGQITNLLSNRERMRNQLSTRGGVQPDLPTNGYDYFHIATQNFTCGAVPALERGYHYGNNLGNDSHKDTRTKLVIATSETAESDNNPNILLSVALTHINRLLGYQVYQSVTNGETFPSIFLDTSLATRKANRASTSLHGPDARLQTSRGTITIRQGWSMLLDYLQPPDPRDEDWQFTIQTIHHALAPTPTGPYALENYLDPKSPAYMRGNPATLLKNHAVQTPGTPSEKINQTNAFISRIFTQSLSQI